MKKEYYDIYRDIYEDYQVRSFLLEGYPEDVFFWSSRRYRPRMLRIVISAVDTAVSELGLMKRIRPDARLFLLVNLHQMVALPLSHGLGAEIERGEIEADLEQDVQTILKVAMKESPQDEISAHRVLNAIYYAWKDLKVNRFEIWG